MKELSERGLDDIYKHIEKTYKKEIDTLKIKGLKQWLLRKVEEMK